MFFLFSWFFSLSANYLPGKLVIFDATAKSPENAAKTTATLQNQVGKVLLTLASFFLSRFYLDSLFGYGLFRDNCSVRRKLFIRGSDIVGLLLV